MSSPCFPFHFIFRLANNFSSQSNQYSIYFLQWNASQSVSSHSLYYQSLQGSLGLFHKCCFDFPLVSMHKELIRFGKGRLVLRIVWVITCFPDRGDNTLDQGMDSYVVEKTNLAMTRKPIGGQPPGPRLNIKTVFPRYGDSHVKDKTVTRLSYL